MVILQLFQAVLTLGGPTIFEPRFLNRLRTSIVAVWLTPLFLIWKTLDFNFGPETSYTGWCLFNDASNRVMLW